MKKVFHLLIFCLFSFPSQALPLLDKEITLQVKNQTLESALDSISRQTGLNFSYSSSSVDVSQHISIDVKNKPTGEVLQQLLGEKYEYKLMRKFVILKKSQIKIEPSQNAENKRNKATTNDYNYITNQVFVKKLCYSDSGTMLGDCPIITNEQNLEVMKKQLTILMLASATTTNAQTQDTTLTTKEQLGKAGKSFTTLVVEAATSTRQAIKIAADEIGKQTAGIKVASANDGKGEATVEISAAESANEVQSFQPLNVTQHTSSEDASMQSTLKVDDQTALAQNTANVEKATTTQSQTIATPDGSHPFLFTIVYPFSFPELHAEKHTYNVSLNLFAGYNGGVTGAELGWIANINRYTMSGFQAAGIANASLGSVTGVQFAGIANLAAKDTAAAQFAGIVNVAQSSRFQLAGITNSAYGNSEVQLAGIVNFSAKGNTAVQAAGIVNAANTADIQIAGIVSAAKQADVQISGIANASCGKNVTQVAAITNVTDTSTFQLGLLNVARKSGSQIGLVNICDTSSGIMLGLVNVARKGALREFEVSSSLSSANVAYRMGTRKFYTFLEGSHGYKNDLWMYGLGVGSQVDFPKNWGMNIEALFQNVSVDFFKSESFNGLSQVRVVGYKRLAKHFSVFAGPALYVYNSDLNGDKPIDFKTPHTIYSNHTNNVSTDIWLGLSAGLRF